MTQEGNSTAAKPFWKKAVKPAVLIIIGIINRNIETNQLSGRANCVGIIIGKDNLRRLIDKNR